MFTSVTHLCPTFSIHKLYVYSITKAIQPANSVLDASIKNENFYHHYFFTLYSMQLNVDMNVNMNIAY